MRWWNGFTPLLTGVFAALCVLSYSSHGFSIRPPSHGFTLLLAHEFDPETVPEFLATDGGCDRCVVLQVKTDGVKINQDYVDVNNLPALMSQIMHARSEKYLFVVGEPGVDFQRFAEAVCAAQAGVPDLHTILITEKDEQSQYDRRVKLPGDPQGRYLLMPFVRALQPSLRLGRPRETR
jgi:hypothetical protein